MARGAIAVQGERPAGQRVVAAHHTHIVAAEEALVVEGHCLARLGARGQVGKDHRKEANRHMGCALVQQAPGIARGQGNDANGDTGRIPVQRPDEAGYEFGSRGIRHGQHKADGGLCRNKRVGAQNVLQLAQCLPHGGPDRQSPWCGGHLLALSFDEFIAHRLAEAAHRIADSGLGDVEVACGPRQAALGHHFVKDAQQVQVQSTEVGGVHGVI